MSLAIVRPAPAGPSEAPTDLVRSDEARYVVETPTGLLFADDTPRPVWEQVIARLGRLHRRIEWALADAINFGEAHYGAKYAEWVPLTGLSKQTLMNIASVGRRVETYRRRENLSFAHHAEVAVLPAPEGDAVLDEAAERAWNRQDVRDAVTVRKRAIAIAAPKPIILPSSIPARIEIADARRLPLADDTVDLIVTSPPYSVDVPYADVGDVAPDRWPAFMAEWLREALRVTKPHGRLALNVPVDTTRGGYRPLYSLAVAAALAAGWRYRSTIVWDKGNLGKSNARGSLDSPASPSIIAPVEMIALLSKGDWGQETPCPPDLSHEDWLLWTNGLWQVSPQQHGFEGHPASFPLEIPRRLISLLSFPGDVVCDPFLGSGSTAVAAVRLGRDAVCFDASPTYVESSRRRVAAR